MHAPAPQPKKRLLRLRAERTLARRRGRRTDDFWSTICATSRTSPASRPAATAANAAPARCWSTAKPVPSCITLAVRCEGRDVETIEGLATQGRLNRLQRAFHEKLGTQCGFCTPGMIMAAEALLRRNPKPSDEDIRTALSGNLCRCTGYVKIIESVQAQRRTRRHDDGPAKRAPRQALGRAAHRRHRKGHRQGALHGRSRSCRRAGRAHLPQSRSATPRSCGSTSLRPARSTASSRSSPATIVRTLTACCRSP